MVPSRTVELARDETGILGIQLFETRHGAAQVSRIEGVALAGSLVEVNDCITHVDGRGPLKFKEVVEALEAAPSPVSLTLERGEPPPPARVKSAVMCVSLLSLAVAVAWMQLDPMDALMPWASQPMVRGINAGGVFHAIEEDGSAADPDALRAAFRADKERMQKMRRERPEWTAIIDGRPDGTYDVKGFQRILRESARLQRMQEKYGNKWSTVAGFLPGRTGQQCAQRWRHRVNPNISPRQMNQGRRRQGTRREQQQRGEL